MAGARYRRNQLSHSDPVREAFADTLKEIPGGQWETNVPWSYYKLKSQSLAAQGRFERAAKIAKATTQTFKNADDELKQQFKAFEKGEVFAVDIDDPNYKPYYLDTPDLMVFETMQTTFERVGENIRVLQLDTIR